MRPDPLNPAQVSKEEYIDWMVKLFDPYQTGFTPNKTVENIIDLMFSSDESNQSANSDEAQSESVAQNLKNSLKNNGVLQTDGFLNG